MKFDKPTIDSILKKVGRGIPYATACEAHNIHYDTFCLWLRLAQRDILKGLTTKYTQFLSDLRDVETKFMDDHLENIAKEKGGRQWLMERVHWRNFSARTADIEFNQRLEEIEKKLGVTHEAKDTEHQEEDE